MTVHGPALGRGVMPLLNEGRKNRPYTSVNNFINVMVDKGLLGWKTSGRVLLYSAGVPKRKSLAGMLSDPIGRAVEELV